MFFRGYVTPLIRRGLAVALLDNTGHVEANRPKGSATKLDAAQQAYKVVTTSKFTPVEPGRLSITCTRSRYGDQDRTWSMRVGGGLFETPKPTSEAPDARRVREHAEARERFRRAAVTVLGERQPLGRDTLERDVRAHGLKGTAKKWHGWLVDLAADPTSGIESDDDGYYLTPGREGRDQGPTTPPPGAPGRPVPSPTEGTRAGPPGRDDRDHPPNHDSALSLVDEVLDQFPGSTEDSTDHDLPAGS